ncbi:MAG TPA: hypothetical protein VMU85_00560 [Stellaceae bacterium]|nr:hypothetical protein [Stellaceae bacterium]
MEDEAESVIIRGRDADLIAFRPIPWPYTPYGSPAAVTVIASTVRAELQTELQYLGEFEKRLESLSSTLSGEAPLWSEGDFKMVLRGNGRGGVQIAGSMIARHGPPKVELSFETDTDQTFLPKILADMRRLFLVDPPPGTQLYIPVSIRIVRESKRD